MQMLCSRFGVAVINSRERPGDYRPLLLPAKLGVAKRRGCDRKVMTPARLSSLRGMALQCSRTHDQGRVRTKGGWPASNPDLPRSPGGDYRRQPGVGLAAPLSRRPPSTLRVARIHACPVFY